MSSDDPNQQSPIVLIDRTPSRSRSSSILGSNAAAINTIVEEDSLDDASIEIIDEPPKPRPSKRLSFAPDPVQYRQARMEHVRTSRRGSYGSHASSDSRGSSSSVIDEGNLESTGGFMSAMRRWTAMALTSSNLPHSSASGSTPNASASEYTQDRSNRGRRREGRTTIFSRGSTTLSVASSSGEDVTQNEAGNTRENPCIRQAHYDFLRWMIDQKAWKYTCYLFIFIMLFGSQIQELWLPKSWDLACDVIYTLAIVFLSLDIIFQSIVDPLYFSWRCGKERRELLPGQRRRYSWFKPVNKYTGCNFAFGSFMFWCDLFGTLTFLNEIEYINSSLREPLFFRVGLSSVGIPISGLYRETGLGGVGNPGMNILVAIGRATRMSRFIRTTVIVEYAAKLDFRKYFQPHKWCQEEKIEPGLEDTGRSSVTSNGRSEKEAQPRRRRIFRDLAASIGIRTQAAEDHLRRSQKDDACKCPPGGKRSWMGQSRDSSSHVGAAMRELTGQRVAIGVIIAMLLNVVFTYKEDDGTPVMTMILLHGQTRNDMFATRALDIARSSAVPNLYSYWRYNASGLVLSETYGLDDGSSPEDIRLRETLNVTIHSNIAETYGLFDNRDYIRGGALNEMVTTIFILVVWVIGVTAFAGPVMTLVVEPIERMVVLLSMLMKDPLGYQNSEQYKSLMEEENLHQNNWDQEVLKGMETSFLMSTIIRIGSLMQVGFGSAGTEIIRSGLERGRHKDVLFLNKQGSTVSCIFLFCDIRSFTDATECLQEEVFVFTNKIAAVVHSICHSFGGSANKNIGDAFLVSWLLDERPPEEEDNGELMSPGLYANNNQADKALLSVVKISIALYHDSYFVEGMSDDKKTKLISKFHNRPGPLVQMGFGLHAGRAVQGAIGSTKKLDATYISESVERAEFLESNTKKYGTSLLMSDAFYNLLDPANKYRCRKIDQLLLSNEDDPLSSIADLHDRVESGEKMNLYTYDMDIAALWRQGNEDEVSNTSSSDLHTSTSSRRVHRTSFRRDNKSSIRLPRRSSSNLEGAIEDNIAAPRELELPTGHCTYDDRCWLAPDIKKIRQAYVTNSIFLPMFESGMIAFYESHWEHAKTCFEHVLTQMDDGPTRRFLKIINDHNCVPPPDFIGYGLEE